MAVRERSALGVLTGEPDRDPVDEQAARKRATPRAPSRSPPVSSAVRRRSSCFRSFGCTSKSSGTSSSCSFSASSRSAETAVTTTSPVSAGMRTVLRRARLGDRRVQLLVSGRSSACVCVEDGVGLGLCQHPFLDEPLDVLLARGRMSLDLRDHERLRVRRLVLLLVTEAPVADEVDDDVVAELLPVGEREPHGGIGRLGIVRVDVDDRDVEALGQVARVARRAALLRIGREADLVVRDDVERAAGRVAVQVREVERLRHDPLPGERGVAVDQDRKRDERDRGSRRRSTGRSARRASSPRSPGRRPRGGLDSARARSSPRRSRSPACRWPGGGT